MKIYFINGNNLLIFETINYPNMKEILFTLCITLASLFCQAQTIYIVSYHNQADVKVFVVKYENQADLNVYKVSYENQAGNNDGKWFFTKYSNQAKKKIYFVDYENQSDLKIYFVSYENQAGWKSQSKKALMY